MKTVNNHQALFQMTGKSHVNNSEYYTSMVLALAGHCELLTEALQRLQAQAGVLSDMAFHLTHTLQSGRKVLVAGNGGSAAQAQHFATELVGRFKRERTPYAVLALTTDTAILTALANDYGYENVFARQVQAFGCPDDLLTVFSTSGESENLLRAVQMGREMGMFTTAFVGEGACSLEHLADLAIQVPVAETPTVQELHMVVIHLLCDIVEAHLCKAQRQRCL